jgi:hypothetical protein
MTIASYIQDPQLPSEKRAQHTTLLHDPQIGKDEYLLTIFPVPVMQVFLAKSSVNMPIFFSQP